MRKSRRYLQPISTRPPNNEEKLQSKMLRQAMQECAIYETEESQKARDKAIATLRSVVRSWAKKSPESDIDAVVIAQSRIRHGAFFGGLQAMLRECKEIRNFVALPNTFAPIMKMTIHGIDVDVSLASLPIHQLPAHWESIKGRSGGERVLHWDQDSTREDSGCSSRSGGCTVVAAVSEEGEEKEQEKREGKKERAPRL
eukprot:jgi/Bigna1/132777/aug1.19_g7485